MYQIDINATQNDINVVALITASVSSGKSSDLDPQKPIQNYQMLSQSVKSSKKSFQGDDYFDSLKLKNMRMSLSLKKPSTTQNIFQPIQGSTMVQQEDVIEQNPEVKRIFAEQITEQAQNSNIINEFLNFNLSINAQINQNVQSNNMIEEQNQEKQNPAQRIIIPNYISVYNNKMDENQFFQRKELQNGHKQNQHSPFVQHNFCIVMPESQIQNSLVSLAQLRQVHSEGNSSMLHPIQYENDSSNLLKVPRKKSARKNSCHSEEEQYNPHRRPSNHKMSDAFIPPKHSKGVGQSRAGANNQCNTQKFIKKMTGYHFSKNFEQFYNSRLSQKFKNQKHFEKAQRNQRIQAIDQIIAYLQSYTVSINKKMAEQTLPKFGEELQKFITQLFQEVFRRTYQIMLNTQKRRILQESEQDANLTSQYFDRKGYEQFAGLFDSILCQKQFRKFHQPLINSHFEEIFKLELASIKKKQNQSKQQK